MKFLVKKLHEDAQVPKQAHIGDGAFDMYSYEDKIIPANNRVVVSTGVSLALPHGFVCFIKDRSGLAVNKGITCMGGVIDAGYRGEYKIVLLNTSNENYFVKKGDRIAQAVLLPIPKATLEVVDKLPETSTRGEGRFGSSGR